MNLNKAFAHLLRPARGGALGVVLVFSVGLTLALKAGLFGIALGGLLVSWYFKYCFFLFDAVVRGVDEPPVLDINALNPFGERRPLVLVGIVGVLAGLVVLADRGLGSVAGVLVAIVAAAALPASVAVLGLEDNPLFALSPRHVAGLIRGLGGWYLAILALIAVYALLGYVWVSGMPWLVLQFLGPLFAILSGVSGLAGVLYLRRDELGIEVWHSPERQAARRALEEERQHARVLDAAFTQARLGAFAAATTILTDWLGSRNHAPEDYRWLCARLDAWPDRRYLRRMAADYIDRLLRLQRNGEALDVVAAQLRRMPDFRPHTALATLQVAEIAARGGAPAVARALLGDFATRYPGDPCVGRAAGLAQSLEGGTRLD
jgi:hypothetical protein